MCDDHVPTLTYHPVRFHDLQDDGRIVCVSSATWRFAGKCVVGAGELVGKRSVFIFTEGSPRVFHADRLLLKEILEYRPSCDDWCGKGPKKRLQ